VRDYGRDVARRGLRPAYDPSLSLAEARRLYFEDNGFGPDGGYDEPWVDFKLGPIPFPFPNTAPRVRAVKFHDLHHVMTGYETNFIGELEISAWEIGSGCGKMIAAWHLNLGGMGVGALLAPRKLWRAFLRGRKSKNFYGDQLDDSLLSMTVGEAKHALGIESTGARANAGLVDVLLFVAAAAAGWIVAIASFAAFAPLALLVAIPFQLARADGNRRPI
jgi:hypothetical protein